MGSRLGALRAGGRGLRGTLRGEVKGLGLNPKNLKVFRAPEALNLATLNTSTPQHLNPSTPNTSTV